MEDPEKNRQKNVKRTDLKIDTPSQKKYTQIETLTNIKTKNREIDRKMLKGQTYR
jgi:hypothetical protein